jgi:hypothetical protein
VPRGRRRAPWAVAAAGGAGLRPCGDRHLLRGEEIWSQAQLEHQGNPAAPLKEKNRN